MCWQPLLLHLFASFSKFFFKMSLLFHLALAHCKFIISRYLPEQTQGICKTFQERMHAQESIQTERLILVQCTCKIHECRWKSYVPPHKPNCNTAHKHIAVTKHICSKGMQEIHFSTFRLFEKTSNFSIFRLVGLGP